MQWFLSQHPRIHIHGQEPKGAAWADLFKWYDALIEAGKWGIKSNKSNDVKNYAIPHYAGSNLERWRKIFGQTIKDFMCGFGPDKPRWGVKALWLSTNQKNIDKMNEIWPDSKWIVCIRDPFTSFESQKNTFVKDQSLEEWIERWIASVQTIRINKFMCIKLDKLVKEKPLHRLHELNRIFKHIEEIPSSETDEFILKWPIVHKVKPDHKRCFKLPEKRKEEMLNKFENLSPLMKEMGY
jgi:hypothetical protein